MSGELYYGYALIWRVIRGLQLGHIRRFGTLQCSRRHIWISCFFLSPRNLNESETLVANSSILSLQTHSALHARLCLAWRDVQIYWRPREEGGRYGVVASIGCGAYATEIIGLWEVGS